MKTFIDKWPLQKEGGKETPKRIPTASQ